MDDLAQGSFLADDLGVVFGMKAGNCGIAKLVKVCYPAHGFQLSSGGQLIHERKRVYGCCRLAHLNHAFIDALVLVEEEF